MTARRLSPDLREANANDGNDIDRLRAENRELKRLNADLDRQNRELRDAIDALLQPAPSDLLARNLAHPSRTRVSGSGQCR
jgi:hypothetical protein